MSHPLAPLAGIGGVIAVIALIVLGTEWMLRRFARVGLTQGAAGWRRGESRADYQKRSREYDRRVLAKLGSSRPWTVGILVVGVVAFVLGLAF